MPSLKSMSECQAALVATLSLAPPAHEEGEEGEGEEREEEEERAATPATIEAAVRAQPASPQAQPASPQAQPASSPKPNPSTDSSP